LEAGTPARLSSTFSPAEGRKFGLTVGGAFLIIAVISRWRGHEVPPTIFALLAVPLLVAGLVVPGRLGPVHRAWMTLALAISRVTTPIVMGLVYFVGFTPLGIARRLLGKNALVHPVTPDGHWFRRDAAHQRGDLERQF
jgi:saxitoxin biosynthesis operon SxtJ-like protein